jgi:hypothetical protein
MKSALRVFTVWADLRRASKSSAARSPPGEKAPETAKSKTNIFITFIMNNSSPHHDVDAHARISRFTGQYPPRADG